jgi:hypothetical protein
LHPARDVTTPLDAVVEPVDVPLIRWPSEEEVRCRLAEDCLPRILLLDQDTPPPEDWDEIEDWVRAPVSPVDLFARRLTVLERWQELR